MKNIDFFTKFNELDNNSINVDFHLHSNWSDGKQSIEDILKYAKKKKLRAIAITDHIRKESTYFKDYKKLIEKLKETEENCVLYSGFEAKVADFDGNIDVKESVVRESDIAIASVHRFPIGRNLYKACEFKKDVAQEIELELSIAALKKGGFNVMGHAGGMSLTYYKEFPIDYFEKIIIACKDNEIAFDLSGRYHKNVIDNLVPLLRKHNPHISVGTDSHTIYKMSGWNEKLKEIIKWQK
jgi:putative hydrolase